MAIKIGGKQQQSATTTLKDIGFDKGMKFYGDLYKQGREVVTNIGKSIWEAVKPHLGKIAATGAAAGAIGTGVATVGVSGMASGALVAASAVGASLPYIAGGAGAVLAAFAAPGVVSTVGGWIKEGYDTVSTTLSDRIEKVRDFVKGAKSVCTSAISAAKAEKAKVAIDSFTKVAKKRSQVLLTNISKTLEQSDGEMTSNEKAFLNHLKTELPAVLNAAATAAENALKGKKESTGGLTRQDMLAAKGHFDEISKAISDTLVAEYNKLEQSEVFDKNAENVPQGILDNIAAITTRASAFSLESGESTGQSESGVSEEAAETVGGKQ